MAAHECSKEKETQSHDNFEARVKAVSLEDSELSSTEYPGLTKNEKTLFQNMRPPAILTSRLRKECFLLEQEKLPLFQELTKNKSPNSEYILKAGLIVNSKDLKLFVPTT